MQLDPLRTNPILLLRVARQVMEILLPQPGTDRSRFRFSPQATALAERMQQISPDVWKHALDEWPEADFFTSALVKKLLTSESPEAAQHLASGLIDPNSETAAIYRSVKDAAFFAAFALGYTYGQRSRESAKDGPRR